MSTGSHVCVQKFMSEANSVSVLLDASPRCGVEGHFVRYASKVTLKAFPRVVGFSGGADAVTSSVSVSVVSMVSFSCVSFFP